MNAYYNELDPFPCRVIETNITRGRLPAGFVDCRSIAEVQPGELIQSGYSQFHLFAGIGGAAYACRLAGIPDDFSIGTMGFPCQDISCAGAQEGIEAERSGLFFYGAALFGVLRPRWLLLENVPNLRTAGAKKDPDGLAAIELVISALEEISYCVLPPVVVGADDAEAPHRRKRVWIVARSSESLADAQLQQRGPEPRYKSGKRERPRHELSRCGRDLEYSEGIAKRKQANKTISVSTGGKARNGFGCAGSGMENPTRPRTRRVSARQGAEGQGARNTDRASAELADAQHNAGSSQRRLKSGQRTNEVPQQIAVPRGSGELADANNSGRRERCGPFAVPAEFTTAECCGSEFRWPSRPGEPQHEWEQPRTISDQAEVERALGGATDGLPARLVRSALRTAISHRRNALKGYGNAWVPQVAVPILKWILEQ